MLKCDLFVAVHLVTDKTYSSHVHMCIIKRSVFSDLTPKRNNFGSELQFVPKILTVDSQTQHIFQFVYDSLQALQPTAAVQP